MVEGVDSTSTALEPLGMEKKSAITNDQYPQVILLYLKVNSGLSFELIPFSFSEARLQ